MYVSWESLGFQTDLLFFNFMRSGSTHCQVLRQVLSSSQNLQDLYVVSSFDT
uniref:Uncharacterized protein n=1 Tax=Leptospira santarosai serovar Arenal str. MAVJ 401 TaxID=1049976 RepID=M6JTX2_9LEPT|nr:hypothetical protein LEP1GSC063_3441 [Leptospira santarosai serovar Arenal str. MAVJ 401]